MRQLAKKQKKMKEREAKKEVKRKRIEKDTVRKKQMNREREESTEKEKMQAETKQGRESLQNVPKIVQQTVKNGGNNAQRLPLLGVVGLSFQPRGK